MDIFLVVNADDFGRTHEINRGVLHAFRYGIVSSTSIMPNFEAFDQAADMVKSYHLPVGIHFNLTEGCPVSESTDVQSLVDSQGRFFKKSTFMLYLMQGRIIERDVRTELCAQTQRCLDAGLQLDHYDSHHHIHVLPMISRVCQTCSIDFGITKTRRISRPVQQQSLRSTAQQWLASFADSKLSFPGQSLTFWGFDLMNKIDKRAVLKQTLKQLQPGMHELMCHPGFMSEENIGLYNLERFDELQALCHESITEQVAESKIKLYSFNDLEYTNAN